MARAEVAFNRREMIRQIGRLILKISSAAAPAVLFIHPGDHADRAFRFEAELFDQLRGLHGDGHTRRIVNRAGAQIPRIEMAGHNDHLLRMLAAFEVGNHVMLSTSGNVCGVSVKRILTSPCAARCAIKSASSTVTEAAGIFGASSA